MEQPQFQEPYLYLTTWGFSRPHPVRWSFPLHPYRLLVPVGVISKVFIRTFPRPSIVNCDQMAWKIKCTKFALAYIRAVMTPDGKSIFRRGGVG